MQDTLAVLLRLLNQEELHRYDGMTPTALDYLGDYADGVEYMPWMIDVVENSGAARVFIPGAEDRDPVDAAHPGFRIRRFISHPSNILAFDQNRPIGNT
jgi:hypothetical protein